MDLSREKGSVDPLGHALFSERVQLGMAYLGELLETPHDSPPLKTKSTHWVIAGIGSSEAHGRFLAYLINSYTPYTAEFWELSSFIQQPKKSLKAGLIVFSQGLSSNAQLALNKKDAFEQCILFSSVTEKTGTPEKQTYLKGLCDEGVLDVVYPPDNEYTLLTRVTGPLTGYAACLQWVKHALSGNTPEKPPLFFETLESARKQGKACVNKENIEHIIQGCLILTQAPLSQFSQNLTYKLTEGLFTPNAQACDLLSFSHGPFQARCQEASHIILLLEKTPQGELLEKKAQPLLECCTTSYSTYQAQLPAPWSIFEFEMFFNGLLETGLPLAAINQIDWPGKGKDHPLYDLSDLG